MLQGKEPKRSFRAVVGEVLNSAKSSSKPRFFHKGERMIAYSPKSQSFTCTREGLVRNDKVPIAEKPLQPEGSWTDNSGHDDVELPSIPAANVPSVVQELESESQNEVNGVNNSSSGIITIEALDTNFEGNLAPSGVFDDHEGQTDRTKS